MSKAVFISHAVKDEALAKEIVSLIEEGIGVPEGEIFCSSLKGYGIPTGEGFVPYIKSQMWEPKVVVLVLTPAYFESQFCLSELGAAWVKSHYIYPILVPPLKFGDVKGVLLGTQISNITDDIAYNQMREKLFKELTFEHKSQTKWDMKRRSFLKAIEPILQEIDGPTSVSAEVYQLKLNELQEATDELDASEAEVRKLKQRLAATEELKDKTELVGIRAKYSDKKLNEKFDAITDEIAKFKSSLKGRAVFMFVLCDYYGKPFKIDWQHDAEEFEAAARFEFLELEDGERVNWSASELKRLSNKLEQLDVFISEHRQDLESGDDLDVPLNPKSQDFWEYHYEL